MPLGIGGVRVVLRLGALVCHALLGLVVQLSLRGVAKVLPVENAELQVTRLWHRGVCKLIGVRIRTVGTPPVGTHLVVANHVSWLDIPVLGAVLPVCFLSKAEVRGLPLLGPLATMADTVYIERGSHGAQAVGEQLVTRLSRGRSVVLFPEGTTSSGATRRRFLTRLFKTAIAAGRDVQPVAVRYFAAGGGESVAPFYGGERMGPHMLRVLAQPRIDVRVTLCQPVSGVASRNRLTQLTHEAIRLALEGELRN